jgi:hypothetical protein
VRADTPRHPFKNVSKSALDSLDLCPRRLYFSSVMRIDRGANKYAGRGTVTHEMMAFALLGRPWTLRECIERNPRDRAGIALWIKSFDQGEAGALSWLAKRLEQALVAKPTVDQALNRPHAARFVEHKMVGDAPGLPLRIKVLADVIDVSDRGTIVTDWKTGGSKNHVKNAHDLLKMPVVALSAVLSPRFPFVYREVVLCTDRAMPVVQHVTVETKEQAHALLDAQRLQIDHLWQVGNAPTAEDVIAKEGEACSAFGESCPYASQCSAWRNARLPQGRDFIMTTPNAWAGLTPPGWPPTTAPAATATSGVSVPPAASAPWQQTAAPQAAAAAPQAAAAAPWMQPAPAVPPTPVIPDHVPVEQHGAYLAWLASQGQQAAPVPAAVAPQPVAPQPVAPQPVAEPQTAPKARKAKTVEPIILPSGADANEMGVRDLKRAHQNFVLSSASAPWFGAYQTASEAFDNGQLVEGASKAQILADLRLLVRMSGPATPVPAPVPAPEPAPAPAPAPALVPAITGDPMPERHPYGRTFTAPTSASAGAAPWDTSAPIAQVSAEIAPSVREKPEAQQGLDQLADELMRGLRSGDYEVVIRRRS